MSDAWEKQLSKMLDKAEAQLKERDERIANLEDLLARTRGVVFTHAMQTYSKTSQKLGEEISEALGLSHE